MSISKKTVQENLELLDEQYSEFSLLNQLLIEPPTCSHFGCGKKLTEQEKLFGKTCVDHQRSINQYMLAYLYFERRKKNRKK